MRNPNYKLAIKSSCQENWEKMSPNSDGKFCDICNKTVVDFTNMSDVEIINFISKPTEKICGKLRIDQLNRALIPKKTYSFLSKEWIASLLFLATLGKQTSFAKSITTLNYYQNTIDFKENTIIKDTLPSNSNNIIYGKVVDNKGEPIIGANMIINDNKKAINTQLDGSFEILIPDKTIKNILQITYTGYKTLVIPITAENFKIKNTFTLMDETTNLMGDVIVIKKPKWYQTKYWFKKKKHK